MTTKKTWQGKKLKKKVKLVWWTGFVTKNGKVIAQLHKKISAVSVFWDSKVFAYFYWLIWEESLSAYLKFHTLEINIRKRILYKKVCIIFSSTNYI